MTINDISPIFLANLQHYVFSDPNRKKVDVFKLKCLKPTNTLANTIFGNVDNIFWGYEDTSCSDRFRIKDDYLCYRIFLPILGRRKYDPKRFKVLDKLTIYKTDFNERKLQNW
jgi:hypothetical protein